MPHDASAYTRQTLDFGTHFDRIVKEHMTADSELDYAAILAIVMGVLQGNYANMNNEKGRAAIEAAHSVFLDEFYR